MCTIGDEETIVKLNNIGVGISGISNFTGMSKTNVINKIKQISSELIKPKLQENQQEYEVDEMHTLLNVNPIIVILLMPLTKKQNRS